MVDRSSSLSAAGDPQTGSGGQRDEAQAPQPVCALRVPSSTFPSVKWATGPLMSTTSQGGRSELTPGSVSSRAVRPPSRSRRDLDSLLGDTCSHGPAANCAVGEGDRTLPCQLP